MKSLSSIQMSGLIILVSFCVFACSISYAIADTHVKTEAVNKTTVKPEVKKPTKKKAAPTAVQKKAAAKAK